MVAILRDPPGAEQHPGGMDGAVRVDEQAADGTDLLVPHVADQCVEPVVVHDLGVVVEQQHERRGRLRHRLVHS